MPQNPRNNGDFEQPGAKSGAVDKNPNDLASILVAIADLPPEQKEALAKLLIPAPAAEKLGRHRNTGTIPSVTIMVLQWI